ncbi:unnamed protein product [Adineta ricciae]|uniref:Uncharacterized protein n=1 Tax=Adineta ricciae TaxID=249248 RepID=A0A813Y6D5_ADIRI|nr:unnamed protein product [Adineta ricciae]
MDTFLNQFDDVNSSSLKAQITDTSKDHAECPAYIHFGHTPYTLGFGHLFSGDSQSCQNVHVNRQCCFTSQISTRPFQPIGRHGHRVDQAMQNIRNNVEQQCHRYHSMRKKEFILQ